MPVKKYRSVAEMPNRLVGPKGAEGVRRALRLSKMAIALSRRRAPSGVHKHASIEQAKAWREEITRQPPGSS